MRIAKILIYPIKGLDPVEVQESRTVEKGSLEGDRRLALFDAEGKVVSGKREKKIHRIRASYLLEENRVLLRAPDSEGEFYMEELKKMSEWFSEVLGYRVFLKCSQEGGFPDDTKAHGPTLVSTATLEFMSESLGIPLEETRLRFRTNVEILHEEPFWEDVLVGKRFKLGEATLKGEGVSKRCPVPTRNPFTGEVYKDFVKRFIEIRKRNLPPWSDREIFKDTFYRLCINTNTLKGGRLRVGDELYLL